MHSLINFMVSYFLTRAPSDGAMPQIIGVISGEWPFFGRAADCASNRSKSRVSVSVADVHFDFFLFSYFLIFGNHHHAQILAFVFTACHRHAGGLLCAREPEAAMAGAGQSHRLGHRD
jgi:hypothetical protein